MLYTASFYNPEHWVGQCYRVSRAHPRGRKTQWDTLPFLYPARQLVRAYRDGQLDFDAFASEYLRGLEDGIAENQAFQEWVIMTPSRGDFTLLCFERTGRPCHRFVLARWLLEREPKLAAGSLR